jgi:hypothetical protein
MRSKGDRLLTALTGWNASSKLIHSTSQRGHGLLANWERTSKNPEQLSTQSPTLLRKAETFVQAAHRACG